MLAEVSFTTEGIAVITALLVALGGCVAMLFKMLMATKDREYERIIAEKAKDALELESVKKSYSEIATEAVQSARKTVDFYRTKDGQPPVPVVAPVISESHSPSTFKQREAAQVATLRAQLAAVKLVAGQDPRQEPPHAQEPGGLSSEATTAKSELVLEQVLVGMEKPLPEKQ